MTADRPRRIVITGASGAVCTRIRPLLAAHELVLIGPTPPVGESAANERYVSGDITDIDLMTDAVTGADLVVHLAGHSGERPWRDILETNIHGTYVVLESARRSGVSRVLLAGSLHSVGRATVADVRDDPYPRPRPDTFYGVGKVAAEALGSLYADTYGMAVVSARMGSQQPTAGNARGLALWLSAADMARLVEVALALEPPANHLVWAVSDNSRRWVSLATAHEMGFVPEDDAEPLYAEGLGAPAELPATTTLGAGWGEGDRPVGGSW